MSEISARWRLPLLGLVLAFGLAGPLRAFPLWGDLEPGGHAVGFRTMFIRDLSRPPLALVDRPGNSFPLGREMRINLWYPAQKTERPEYLTLEDYVFLAAQELEAGPLTEDQKRESRDQFTRDSLTGGASAEKLADLLRMRTGAIREATPAAGRFPLVVFTHATPATASTMSEYLASHGFVVAAVTSKGSFTRDYYHDVPDLETVMTDLAFVVGQAKTLEGVDGGKIATIGMSAGSIAALGLHLRNPDVGAVVSLDGTIGEEKGSFLVTRNPYYDISRIQAPLLHLYAPNNSYLDLSRLRSWRYSPRTLLQFPRMRHADFLAYGIFEHFVPNILGASPGDTKAGFEWVCRYTLRFLQAHLLRNQTALVFLENAPEANGSPAGLLTLERQMSLPPPLSVAEVRKVLEQEGIAKLTAVYRQRKATDPRPIPRPAFLQIGKDLLATKRHALAKDFFGLFLDAFPESVEAHDYMASAALGLGDEKLAKAHFEQVLRWVDVDPDADFRTRTRLKAAARRALDSPGR